MPEFYRALIESEIWVLLPYHPEMEDAMIELKNGMAFPFVQLEDKQGAIVPVFSSEECLKECFKQAKIPSNRYNTAAMEGKQLMQILGSMELRAVINKSSRTTGTAIIPWDLMCDLASGKALVPIASEPERTDRLKIIEPASFPTDIVQQLFEVLRQYSNFRAAWIFTHPKKEAEPDGRPHYQVLVLMDPRDEAIYRDLSIVVAELGRREKIESGYLNEKDPSFIESLFRQAIPFFIASDYLRPPGAKE